MRKRNRLLFVALFLPTFAFAGEVFARDVIVLVEQQIRAKARTAVLPKYPVGAAKKKAQGVVVSQIEWDPAGVVTSVQIIESPNPYLSESTSKALKQWVFSPVVTPQGEVLGGRGKLTFYFYFKNGRGWSENPLIFSKGAKPSGS